MMFPKDGNYHCRKCGSTIPIESDAKNFVSKAKIDDHEVVVLRRNRLRPATTNAKMSEWGTTLHLVAKTSSGL